MTMQYFDDDGNELFPNLIRKPMLCVICRVDRVGEGMDRVLCNMNRLDQRDDEEFYCGAFQMDDAPRDETRFREN